MKAFCFGMFWRVEAVFSAYGRFWVGMGGEVSWNLELIWSWFGLGLGVSNHFVSNKPVVCS